MNKQPEALRLADSLWALVSTVYSNGALEASAAELRRLHAELERCKRVCAATSEAWREEAALAEDALQRLTDVHQEIEVAHNIT